jgi:hypothetical protein
LRGFEKTAFRDVLSADSKDNKKGAGFTRPFLKADSCTLNAYSFFMPD